MPLINTIPFIDPFNGPGWNAATAINMDSVTFNEATTQSFNQDTIVLTSVFRDTGKYYYEVVFDVNSGSMLAGLATADATDISTLSDAGSFYSYYPNDGRVFIDNVNVGTASSSAGTGDVLGIAYDADANEVTVYRNGTQIDQRTFTPGAPVSPAAGGDQSNVPHGVTATWAPPFAQTVPSGFSPWPES